jgi:quercetin dioxygenase-like cupin family protein
MSFFGKIKIRGGDIMNGQLIKNIDFSRPLELEGLVDYQQGQVVSRTLAQGKPMSVTLFAFDKGEQISTHASTGDAMVYIMDGQAEITIGEEKFNLTKGQTIVMPANVPHGLEAIERFKMLLIVVFTLT